MGGSAPAGAAPVPPARWGGGEAGVGIPGPPGHLSPDAERGRLAPAPFTVVGEPDVQLTLTLPFMSGWIWQEIWYVPALAKVSLYWYTGAPKDRMSPELWKPLPL